MIHYICALKCEARPLVDHFTMAHLASEGPLKLYVAEKRDRSLAVSGVGNAAAAVAFTAKQLPVQRSDAWLNVGIAGHRSMQPGSAALANRVRSATGDIMWYPQILFATRLPKMAVLTMDAPASDYGGELVEMEAAGFCEAAGRLATAELIQVIKVISDSPQYPARDLSAARVTQLIAAGLGEIVRVDRALGLLSAKLQHLDAAPPYFAALLECMHFSVTQRYRLAKLLRRWALLCPSSDPRHYARGVAGSATELLNRLERELDGVPFRL